MIKYRKGACENCGAMTHKRKDCMERPRKVGAKYSGTNILPDEFIQKNLALSFDGKRDRWSGYDPTEHKTVIEEFQKVSCNFSINPNDLLITSLLRSTLMLHVFRAA